MDYLLDQASFLPEDWKPVLKQRGMELIAWSDWFVGLRDPREIFDHHPTLVMYEFLFYFLGSLTFLHAWRTGSRYWYVWLAVLVHGLNTECLSYLIPDFDSFWHAQASVMLLGRRLPLQVILVYAMFDYTACVAARKLRLNWLAEGCAAGLFAVLLDIPYDILGVKNLWWTWHDTDPNVFDRTYNVPWTSYYFHAAFACSLTLLLRAYRRLLLSEVYDWKAFPREFLCAALAGLSAFWLGAIQFVPLYHLLHDVYWVHTEVCTLTFLALYATVVFHAVANKVKTDQEVEEEAEDYLEWVDPLGLMVVLHYAFFMCLAVISRPQDIQSTGLHEPLGPHCRRRVDVRTVSGMTLSKRQYLCGTDFHEPYYSWHCDLAKGGPPDGSDQRKVEWYTICGTAFENQWEYGAVVWAASLLGLYYFYHALRRSLPLPPVKIYPPRRRRSQRGKEHDE